MLRHFMWLTRSRVTGCSSSSYRMALTVTDARTLCVRPASSVGGTRGAGVCVHEVRCQPSDKSPKAAVLSLLIRLDFVLAVVLLVASPLGLLVAAVRRPMLRQHLLAYWRASSLLMITVYLMIDGRPVAFVAGNAALVLIPIALWYGDVLFAARQYRLDGDPIAEWFRRWRVAAALFCGASLVLTLPTLHCAMGDAMNAPTCIAWLGPPRELHAALHPMVDPATLGDGALIGLAVYGMYLLVSVGAIARHVACEGG